MPVAALIPIRSFESGNMRLASTMTPKQRTDVGTGLADRTIAAAEQAGLLPAIVTRDDQVTQWAVLRGLSVVPEPGEGLDNAAVAGVMWAAHLGLQWLILHSDLPLVRPDDLRLLVGPIERGLRVIAPSADCGTTAISSPTLPRFAYGPGSFHRHLRALGEPEVVMSLGLLLDLDSPIDLAAAMSHPEGSWLQAIVGTPIRQ